MATLTARILNVDGEANHAGIRRRMRRVCDKLVPIYGQPPLGNFNDPLDEIAFIVLSARTTETLYVRAHDRLRAAFPRWSEVAFADPETIAECIAVAGLGEKRARHLIAIYRRLFDDFGDQASDTLKSMSEVDVFAYLTALPGIAAKTALCIMMWSLGHDVLPADTHVARVMARLGAIPPGLRPEYAQRAVAPCAPAGHSKALHTVLVLHGREVCNSRNPRCDECCLSRMCPSRRDFQNGSR